MLPILGQPIVERMMESLHRHGGVREFILVVSENDHDIRRHFAEESLLDVHIQFVMQPERLGMANALACAAYAIRGDFILSACDNLVADEHVADLVRTWQTETTLDGVLSVMRIGPELLGRTGIVELVNGRVAGRLTLTGPEDLLAINRHYLVTGHGRPQLAPFTVGPNTHLITPLRIEEGTVIGEGCVIGPRVYIERDCRIGSQVTIQDAVVLRGAVLEDGAMVAGEVVS